jgi:cytochrome c2
MKLFAYALMAAVLSAAAAPVSLAEGDAVNGAKVFRKCKACHGFDPAKRKMGPHLKNIVGREVAAVEGYKYSKAFQASDIVWDVENLTAYLQAPRKFMKGTKMAFAGLRKPQDIEDVLAYMEEQSQ